MFQPNCLEWVIYYLFLKININRRKNGCQNSNRNIIFVLLGNTENENVLNFSNRLFPRGLISQFGYDEY